MHGCNAQIAPIAATLSAAMMLSGILAEGTVAGTSVGEHATSSQTTIGARDGQRIMIAAPREEGAVARPCASLNCNLHCESNCESGKSRRRF
ncbi:MAG: hypothetical protein EXS10_09275 [Phycisphaerales bacterium]|nr:hypothetical protein [Phycisphaerales bacterium]